MSSAIKLFSVDLAQPHTEDTIEETLSTTLRAMRKSGQVEMTFAYDARHVYVIGVEQRTATIWALTEESCSSLWLQRAGLNPAEIHICAGAGAMIRCMVALSR